MKRMSPGKRKKNYILLALLLITIALLISVSIYCYLLKFQIPFCNTSNKLEKFCIDSTN